MLHDRTSCRAELKKMMTCHTWATRQVEYVKAKPCLIRNTVQKATPPLLYAYSSPSCEVSWCQPKAHCCPPRCGHSRECQCQWFLLVRPHQVWDVSSSQLPWFRSDVELGGLWAVMPPSKVPVRRVSDEGVRLLPLAGLPGDFLGLYVLWYRHMRRPFLWSSVGWL